MDFRIAFRAWTLHSHFHTMESLLRCIKVHPFRDREHFQSCRCLSKQMQVRWQNVGSPHRGQNDASGANQRLEATNSAIASSGRFQSIVMAAGANDG